MLCRCVWLLFFTGAPCGVRPSACLRQPLQASQTTTTTTTGGGSPPPLQLSRVLGVIRALGAPGALRPVQPVCLDRPIRPIRLARVRDNGFRDTFRARPSPAELRSDQFRLTGSLTANYFWRPRKKSVEMRSERDCV